MIVVSVIAIGVSLMLLVYFMSKKHEAQQKAKGRQRNSSPSLQPQSPSEKTLPGIERVTTLLDTMKKFRKEYTWTDNVAIGFIALVLIHIGAYLLLENQYSKYFWNRGAFFTQVALGAGFAMRVSKKDAKPPQHWLGSIVLVMALLVVGKYTIWPLLPGLPTQASTARTSEQNVYIRGTTATPPTEMFDEECAARAATLNKEMREKIKADFKDQLMMTPIACRESGFNQTKPGTTEVLQGKQDPNDHGVFMINRTNHASKIAELKLDVDKYEGQVAYVRYLLGTPQGIDHWFPEVSGRWYAPMTVNVPVTKKWSGFVQMPKLTKEARYLIKNNKPILAEIDGKEVVITPNSDQQLGSFRNIRFKALEGNDDTIVAIPIKFWPVP